MKLCVPLHTVDCFLMCVLLCDTAQNSNVFLLWRIILLLGTSHLWRAAAAEFVTGLRNAGFRSGERPAFRSLLWFSYALSGESRQVVHQIFMFRSTVFAATRAMFDSSKLEWEMRLHLLVNVF